MTFINKPMLGPRGGSQRPAVAAVTQWADRMLEWRRCPRVEIPKTTTGVGGGGAEGSSGGYDITYYLLKLAGRALTYRRILK